MHANPVRVNTVHARAVHANTVHARAVHANTVHANTVHANTVHANTVHARAVHANTVHSDTVHANIVHDRAVHADPEHADSIWKSSLQFAHQSSIPENISIFTELLPAHGEEIQFIVNYAHISESNAEFPLNKVYLYSPRKSSMY